MGTASNLFTVFFKFFEKKMTGVLHGNYFNGIYGRWRNCRWFSIERTPPCITYAQTQANPTATETTSYGCALPVNCPLFRSKHTPE